MHDRSSLSLHGSLLLLALVSVIALPVGAQCTKPPSIGLSILPPDGSSTQYRAVISHSNLSVIEIFWQGTRQEINAGESPAIRYVNDTTCMLETLPYRVVGHALPGEGCSAVEQTATIAPLDDKPEVVSINLAAPGPESYIYKATVHHRNAWRLEYVWRGQTLGNFAVGTEPVVLELDANCLTDAETLTVRVSKTGCPIGEKTQSVPPLNTTPQISTTGLDGEGKVNVHYSFPHTYFSSRRIFAIDMPTDRSAPLGWDSAGGRSLPYTGDATIPINAGPGVLVATAQSCPGVKTTTTSPRVGEDCVPCPPKSGIGECPKGCVGGPVSTQWKSMQYRDVDPIVAADVLPISRSYNSTSRLYTGLFGSRWRSMFDAFVQTYDNTLIDLQLANVVTENGLQYVFERKQGAWVQISPAETSTHGTLVETGDGGWLHTDAGGRFSRRFDSSGVPLSYRDVTTGREVVIGWTGTLPSSLTDSWGNWSLDIITDPNGRHITSIGVSGRPDLVWTYVYWENALLRVESPAGTWRSYEYQPILYHPSEYLPLAVIRDGAGNVLERHSYSTFEKATDSYDASGEIEAITTGLAGRKPSELRADVRYKSGAVETFYRRWTGTTYRVVETSGGCASCGGKDSVLAYHPDGTISRKQGPDGYINTWHYDFDGRVIRTGTAFRPIDCDPATDAAHCRLLPEDLAAMSALGHTNRTVITEYTYGDVNWPDRPTLIVATSVVDTTKDRRETMTYDAQTGRVLTRSITGWTTDPLREETRTTTTALYDGVSGAVFAPGGAFAAEWLTLPQPIGLPRETDGPRSDVADVTRFVYFPIHPSVPGTLRGRIAAIRNAAGHMTRFEEYDVHGNSLRVIDANGIVTSNVHDGMGRLVTTTLEGVAGCDTSIDPLCSTPITSSRSYNAGGPVTVETRPNGVTTYEYDSRARILRISRGPSVTDLRERIEYSYDTLTGKKSQERRLERVNGVWTERFRTSYTYDLWSQLEQVVHADGRSQAFTYDAEGRVATMRDENHATPNTRYRYDAAGQIAEVEQWLEGGWISTSYDTDAHGNLVSVIDPNGNRTLYTFDDFGQLRKQESPVTGTTRYTYDVAGNLLTSTDANNAVTTRTYDVLGRATEAVSTRNGESETVTWNYDSGTFSLGRLASMSDPAGSTSYAYERRGLVALETKTIGGASTMTRFRHDANGNRSLIVDPAGHAVDYGFDFAGRPVSAMIDGTPAVTAARYLPFGPRIETTLGNGTTQRWTFDARYRPLSNQLLRGTATVAAYGYGHDFAGNITSIQDQLDPGFNRTFGYDDLNRLTTANSGSSLWGIGSYSYDAMGNMQTLSLGPARNATFAYEGLTPKLASVTENAVTRAVDYDASGNEILAGADAFAYSPRNHLVDGEDTTYVYDGRGIRTITSRAMPLPEIASLIIEPPSVAGGGNATATITLSSAAPAGGVTVDLTSDRSAVAAPAFVLVPAGSMSANAILTTSAVASDVTATLTATLGASTGTAVLTVTAPRLLSITVSATQVTGGTAVTGTITLDGIAPEGGLAVSMSSSAATAGVPTQVDVAANAMSADFAITTSPVSADVTVTITASLAGISRTASLTVTPPGLAQLHFAPQSLRGGSAATGTVSLGGPAPAAGATILLSSSAAELTLPASVTVASGATSATFTASASPVETSTAVVVTSQYLGTSQTGIVTITPPELLSFDVTPPTIIGGEAATAQATIDAPAASAGASMAIDSSDTAVVPPATLTVPGGATTATTSLPTNPVAASTTIVVSATRNGITRSSVVTVQPPPVTLASLLIAPASLVGSNTATGTITLTHPAPSTGLEVELTSSDPARASVPSMVAVPANATQASFAIATVVVPAPTSITITATHGVTSKTANLALQPPASNYIASLSATPQFIVGGTSATGTVTLASPSTTNGGSVVALTSSDPSLLVPSTVTVRKNQTSETFTMTTTVVSAPKSIVVTASHGGVVQRLTVIVAPENTVTIASFSLSPPRVAGGNPVAGTITLSAPAPFGGATVTLTPSRRNMITVPQNVTITEGVTSATFVVGTDPVHGNKDRAVDIDATYNGLSRIATLTLTPSGAAMTNGPAAQCASLALVPCVTATATRVATAMAAPRVDRYSFYTPELNLLAESEESASADKAIRYSYVWFAGQPFAQIDNATGQIAYYFNDHLGTPILQTSSTGEVVWRVEREPFGSRFVTRVGADRHQPLSFPGQEDDRSSELSYNIFRHYRAGWGRYTQSDPIGIGGGLNLYSYASSNPIRMIDPLGLTTWDCTIGIVGASLPIGPGAIFVAIDCKSKECDAKGNGLEVVLTGSAVGLSAGLPVDVSAFTATVVDDDSVPRASSLDGRFLYGSAGAALGIGGSYSQIVIGSAKSKPGLGGAVGVGGGIEVFAGAVAVVSAKEYPCCTLKE